MAASGFKIGIEMELLLSPRDQPQHSNPDMDTFVDGLVKTYNRMTPPAFPRMHSDINGTYDGPNNTLEWSVTQDVSLTEDLPNHWPVEIVSPIMPFSQDSPWRDLVQEVWVSIMGSCLIRTDQTCGTHVHISPLGNLQWHIKSLKHICRSILWFESALEVVVPKTRRGNAWAKSNRFDNSKFQGKDIAQCFQLVDQCSNNTEIADLMNDNGDRHYGWNFTNLYDGGIMTIEFRRGPGVTEVGMCLGWVELAVSFIQSAQSFGTLAQLTNYPKDVQGFKDFIIAGLEQGVNKYELMTPIFQGKSGSLEPIRVGNLTLEQRQKLHQKTEEDRKKSLIRKKFMSYSAQH